MKKITEQAHEAEEETYSEDVPKKRKVVIPGEVIVSGEDFLPGEGAKREGNDVIATRFGLAEEAGRMIKVIAITGAFIPRRNNVVIGRVTNITMNGWVIDIDWASSAFLPIDESPRFIILEYLKGGKNPPAGGPVVLIGKGVTFDTGGLQVKPGEHMYEMHMDMSGGAAVIHAVVLAAKLKLKKNIIGLVPAVENAVSSTSFRPGDILKTMSGKTVEVLHTDGEGRIILADALTYAERYKPKLVIDVATLSGSAIVALGQQASAIFSKDEKLIHLLRELGETSGDYVWPMPLWEEYEENIKSAFSDIANVSKSRYSGTSTGAIFLYQFAKNFPWVHIVMAPRMTSIEGEHLAKGATGAPVRLLFKLLKHY